MLQPSRASTDPQTMRIGGEILLQSQMVELPADLMQLQLRFTEKMLKATIAQKVQQQVNASTASAIDVMA
jgi:hypothetical protein